MKNKEEFITKLMEYNPRNKQYRYGWIKGFEECLEMFQTNRYGCRVIGDDNIPVLNYKYVLDALKNAVDKDETLT